VPALIGTNIGTGTTAGAQTVAINSTDYDVSGGGTGIGGTADGLHFAGASLSGDFDIRVQILSLDSTTGGSQGGLMTRFSTMANDSTVGIVATPGGGFAFVVRNGSGQAMTSTTGGSFTAGMWVRLKRVGDTLTGFYGADGLAWTQLDTTTFTQPAQLMFGIAVSSRTDSVTATGQFRSLGYVS
jgi:hypothetical protein